MNSDDDVRQKTGSTHGMTDETAEFNMDRVAELHAKQERVELTDEEREELVAMLADLSEQFGPVLESMTEAMSATLRDFGDAMRPLVACVDTGPSGQEDSHER